PVLVTEAGEGDALSVGRPRGLAVLEVAARQLPWLSAVDVDDEEMLAPVAREADAVELVEDPFETPGRPLLVVLFIGGRVAHPRGKRDPRRVGRPRDRLDALFLIGQL